VDCPDVRGGEARGFLGLFDRERGTALGITLFDSEEAIRGAEQAFEDMAAAQRSRGVEVEAVD
jgi:hypothetical protein